jgi:hypothetical protein
LNLITRNFPGKESERNGEQTCHAWISKGQNRHKQRHAVVKKDKDFRTSNE